jgi:copper chaperone CopZ
MAGTARQCPADCQKLCCTGTEVTYLVEGLVCTDCSSKVTAALAQLDGVAVEAVCHNTGQARLRYDPAKVAPKALIAAIVAAGHPVTGERISLEVPGMTNETRAAGIESSLQSVKGVLRIVTTVAARPTLTVTIDPSLTTRAEILATIKGAEAEAVSN